MMQNWLKITDIILHIWRTTIFCKEKKGSLSKNTDDRRLVPLPWCFHWIHACSLQNL